MSTVKRVLGLEPVAVDQASQEVMVRQAGRAEIAAAQTVVDDDDVVILEVDLAAGQNHIALDLENIGDAALSGLDVRTRRVTGGSWRGLVGSDDWADPVLGCFGFVSTTRPNNLAADGTSQFDLWVSGAVAVQVRASCATQTTVRISGNASRG